ncbi:hypothetical protein L1887_27149 [Cichorium endivia]|nr:hypothetical protein L1887_27149 [Cichorium endivia]
MKAEGKYQFIKQCTQMNKTYGAIHDAQVVKDGVSKKMIPENKGLTEPSRLVKLGIHSGILIRIIFYSDVRGGEALVIKVELLDFTVVDGDVEKYSINKVREKIRKIVDGRGQLCEKWNVGEGVTDRRWGKECVAVLKEIITIKILNKS